MYAWKMKKEEEQEPGGPWLGQLSDGDGAAVPKWQEAKGAREEGLGCVCSTRRSSRLPSG